VHGTASPNEKPIKNQLVASTNGAPNRLSFVHIPAEGIEKRISAALDALGTRKNAASMVGVSADSLARYMRGDNTPPFDVMARLCAAANLSLDWLATGEDSYSPAQPDRPGSLNPAHMTLAIQAIEDAVTIHKARLPAAPKAEAVSLIYELLAGGLAETDAPAVASRAVKLALMTA